MTIPGLDYGYINPALLGNEHDRYFDACDQHCDQLAGRHLPHGQLPFVDKSHPTNQLSKFNKLATNQPCSNLHGSNLHGANQCSSNAQSNQLAAGQPTRPTTNGKSSFKLKSGDLRRFLKRRYSENVIGNLPVNDKMTNHSPTMPNLSKNNSGFWLLFFWSVFWMLSSFKHLFWVLSVV